MGHLHSIHPKQENRSPLLFLSSACPLSAVKSDSSSNFVTRHSAVNSADSPGSSLLSRSVVLHGHGWRILLHSDPAGAADRLRTLLERVLGGEDGGRKLPLLVCRYEKERPQHARFHTSIRPLLISSPWSRRSSVQSHFDTCVH